MPLNDPDARKRYYREYNKRWYSINRVKRIAQIGESTKRRRAKLHEFVAALKTSVGKCSDCKTAYPHWILDFDHVRGKKFNDVGTLVSQAAGKETILVEIAKCEIVCSNCHRDRTYKRRLKNAGIG